MIKNSIYLDQDQLCLSLWRITIYNLQVKLLASIHKPSIYCLFYSAHQFYVYFITMYLATSFVIVKLSAQLKTQNLHLQLKTLDKFFLGIAL